MENTNLVLAVDPKEFGIEETKALELTVGLNPILEARAVLIEKFNEIKDLEPTKENVNLFKELGKEFLKNRTQGINEWHRKGKEVSLRTGQLFDAVKRNECNTNENYENFLESKAKHFENLEKERIAKLRVERWERISKYVEFEPQGLAEMSPDTFEAFESGLIARHEAKVKAEQEAKAEEERLAKIEDLRKERNNTALPYYEFWSEFEKTLNFGEQSQVDFDNFMNRLVSEKQKKDEEIRLQEIENAKLKAEAEKREKEIEAQLEKQRLAHLAQVEKERKEAEAKQKAIEDQVRIEREKAEAIQKAEAEKTAKLEAELKAKKEAESKAEQAKKDAEIQAKKEADKLAKAPIKQKLKVALDALKLELPESDITADILSKFDGFKRWATSEIEKL